MSDPHLLALLRALRLRQNAPDAVAAGAADVDAALGEIPTPKKAGDDGEEAGMPPSHFPEEGAAGLLWRGDPGEALGRSSLQSRYGPDRGIPPVGGVVPSGPTGPVPNIPPVAPARRIGGPGTEFPPPQGPGGHPGRRRPGVPGKRGTPRPDGIDPADGQALRDTQRLLRASLTAAGGIDDVADRLWTALRQAQPALLDALPGSPETQRTQLSRALTWLVGRLDDPPALVAGCIQLGAVLAECGIPWTRLRVVGAALAEAMRAGMAPGAWRQDFDQAWRWTWQHLYEWLVHGGTLVAYQPTVWPAEVIEHDVRRADLAVITLRPSLPMPFRPGQYTRIEVDAVPGVRRPYSVAGSPHHDELIELHVRAKTETGVSGTLVHRTRPGDRVRLTRPEGDMGLPAEPRRGILMIAGDTGVAPMKAILAELAATDDNRAAVLFWGVRDRTELYDLDALTDLAAQAPRAAVVPVVAEGDPGPYESGLVTDVVAAFGEWAGFEVYLAGPPLMLTSTSSALHRLGVQPERIHHDPVE
ncbi:FAD-binding oxidoreductase [Actinoplanes flavus]|uniref:Flavohemoprotein n=1 Tax=Actinoplanes flavus TaxID=2820290 RepID=A0ABS3UE40_9ACTN|nr:FAD-binding oxidoreductase [Actinoplanes flavus]MBO3737052.1 flavohemoprotein [Actinoplanes flavus]